MQRILIVGAGANQAPIIRRARELGIWTLAADGSPTAPGLLEADAAEVVNILDADELVRIAERHDVGGLYVAAELAVESTAAATTRLGLPGVPPEVAHRMRSKLAMRRCLEEKSIPNPRFRGVTNLDEAEAAGKELGVPIIVKPADANASKGVTKVEEPGALPAAFALALRYARAGTVLLEEFLDGEEFGVDGLVCEERYILGGITAKERSAPPNRFDLGIFMPPPLPREAVDTIEKATGAALKATGFTSGTTHIEIILTEEGPRIVEMAGRPGGGRIPSDLIPLCYGMDFVGDSLRIALGESTVEAAKCRRGAALYWVSAEPGIVTGIHGIDQVRALPEVHDVVMSIKVGELVEPIVDCVTRDRIGYVITSAATSEEARAVAKRAASLCHVSTAPPPG